MKIEEKGLRFGLLYVSFVGLLALFNFGLQSESEFYCLFLPCFLCLAVFISYAF